MYFIAASLFALAAGVPQHSFSSSTHSAVASANLPRAASSAAAAPLCSENETKLLCQGPHKYGLCNSPQPIIWQEVAAGTECQCSTSGCAIVAAGATSHGSIAASTPVPSQTAPGLSWTTSYSSNPETLPPSSNTVPSQSSPTSYGPPTSTPLYTNCSRPSGKYTQYSGDGSSRDCWPSMNEWLTFEELWKGYESMIGQSCTTAFDVPNNTPQESNNLKNALIDVSKQGDVPSNFALTIMLQESLGCVHVDTTENGVNNPGIFQSHNGKGTCWKKATCPASEIRQMALDGICGTPYGYGLQQLATLTNATGAQKWYRTARLYNSGNYSIDFQNLNDGSGSTPCYVMDIANRLVGNFFTGISGCHITAT